MKVVDFNKDRYVELDGLDSKLEPMKFKVSKTLHDCDYLVSAAVPKTHDTVIATLSIKNIVVGSLVTVSEKQKIHQGYKAININIARISQRRMPDLAVVDGFVGMEGEGPDDGDPSPSPRLISQRRPSLPRRGYGKGYGLRATRHRLPLSTSTNGE